jgi:hypothetical protein
MKHQKKEIKNKKSGTISLLDRFKMVRIVSTTASPRKRLIFSKYVQYKYRDAKTLYIFNYQIEQNNLNKTI